MQLDALVRETLTSLLRELVDGPPGDGYDIGAMRQLAVAAAGPNAKD